MAEDFAKVDDGLCSCGHHVLDHGYIDDGNGWEASPCRLCTCLDSDWGEPSLSFRDEARKALARALDESLLRSEPCEGTGKQVPLTGSEAVRP